MHLFFFNSLYFLFLAHLALRIVVPMVRVPIYTWALRIAVLKCILLLIFLNFLYFL